MIRLLTLPLSSIEEEKRPAIPKAFGIALQILLRPSVDAIECFFDVLD